MLYPLFKLHIPVLRLQLAVLWGAFLVITTPYLIWVPKDSQNFSYFSRILLLELHQLPLIFFSRAEAMTFQLAGVLEHLPADVQGEILGVHHAADKAEVVRQQVGTLVHDEYAGAVKLKSFLILPGIEVVGGCGGYRAWPCR